MNPLHVGQISHPPIVLQSEYANRGGEGVFTRIVQANENGKRQVFFILPIFREFFPNLLLNLFTGVRSFNTEITLIHCFVKKIRDPEIIKKHASEVSKP
jgi:hypothetical protein